MFNCNSKVSTLLNGKRFFSLLLFLLFLNSPVRSQNLEIWEIQGTGNTSPFLGQMVSLANNVVTAVGEDFFFVQTPAARSDNNDNTSDGLFIYTGFFPGLSVGQLVNISGTIREFENLTEISGTDLNYQATGATSPLPAPVVLTNDFPSSAPAIVRDLEKVENMLVTFTAPVIAPALGNDLAAFSTATERPFREAGIKFPGLNDLPVWDGNPEIFWLDPDALNQPNNRFLSVGQTVTATGVFYQSEDLYIVFPNNYSVEGNIALRDLPRAAANEITVGSINVLQLREDSDVLDIQLDKVSRYIVDRLGAPDIIALQEVGDIGVLQELTFAINQRDPSLEYTPYLIQGNNNTPINSAYLVSERIQDVEVRQLGSIETLSIGGRLHDRPPLLLEANLPTTPPIPIKIINLHLRSLGGIEDSNSFFVRTKRYEQSLSVAAMIQQRQNDNLLVIGDFNALPFSDGYVDVLTQLTGTSSLGAEYPTQALVTPPLINHAFANDTEERYSFVFQGNAQLLDHCLTNSLTNLNINDFAFARGNADAASAYFANPSLATRASDHDGFVLYLQPDFPIISSVNEVAYQEEWKIPNPVRAGQTLYLPKTNEEKDIVLFNLQGQQIKRWEKDLVSEITLPQLPGGCYLLVCGKQRKRLIIQ
jgi:hypothetical protein